jgi:hypothetical protein
MSKPGRRRPINMTPTLRWSVLVSFIGENPHDKFSEWSASPSGLLAPDPGMVGIEN